MAETIQIRRDTATNWTTVNPVLAQGELGIELGTNSFKIGDGVSAWLALPYFGGGGGGGSGLSYLHTQSSPSSVWTINHNLGIRPSVELFTVGGAEFDADVQHTSINQTVVTLVAPLSGSARLN